ncbi:acyltransferase [Deinococcus peraridilitoris]|nr:acyltransferase [Deinococcus peraridilitoris]
MTTRPAAPALTTPPAETASTDEAHTLAKHGAARIAAIDLFRGLAILEVVLHHLSGVALRFTQPDTLLREALMITNRTLHFAVPAFLFMTAVVLTRAALKDFRPGRYYWNRVKKSLLPYVLWTVLYVLFRVFTSQDPPSVLTDATRWQLWLQYGKGYFHLYFLLIALQFYLVLPLLLPLVRRTPPFLVMLSAAFALQFAVYFLNRSPLINFRYPGTMALWYIPAITLGMYFGAHYSSFERFWLRYRPWIVGTALFALIWYIPQGVTVLSGGRVNTIEYSSANWVYTTAMALTLFGVAHSLARGPVWLQRPLALLGASSLQVYLIHPAVLFFFNRWGYPGETVLFVLTLLGYAVLALAIPLGIAHALKGSRLSLWLFGR